LLMHTHSVPEQDKVLAHFASRTSLMQLAVASTEFPPQVHIPDVLEQS
jgi:hypothetical protein